MATRPSELQPYTLKEQQYSGYVAAGMWVVSIMLLLWLGLWSNVTPSPL